tara:strand:+ start:70 stop:2502 length:2433 start_codon:yes stop_codon:yes gene_type:complete
MSGPIGSSQWMYSSGSASFFSHTIDQSLRFEEADGANLKRDITSSSNMKTWTWSAWVKRTNLDGSHGHQYLFTDGKSSSLTSFIFNSSDQLYAQLRAGGSSKYKLSNQVFRDTSAWYHLVWRVDTTQATAEDRSRVYVNGTQITSWSTEQNVNQDTDSTINQSGNDHLIGGYSSGTSRNFNGYMAEVNFIDGISYGPENFGETSDGVWIPKQYSGSYGTNGFYLTFANSSAIGDDLSGNTNDFTPSNLVASDVVPDSPTNNFATLNPIEKDVGATFKEGNLEVTTGSGFDLIRSTFFVSSGKWYWEVRATDCGSGFIGVSTASDTGRGGQDSNQSAMLTTSNGNIRTNATSSSYGNSVSDGDIIGVALDMDNGKLYFAENNTYYNSGDPANQTNPAVTGLTTEVSPSISLYDAEDYNINFGQDSTFAGLETAGGNADANGIGDFKYAPPSGFLALCTSNLPDITIGPGQTTQADDHFDVKLYTATGSTLNITGIEFQPDWIWAKRRDDVQEGRMTDSVRGVNAQLRPAATNVETTFTNAVTSFNSDGFTLGVDTGPGSQSFNYYTDKHVAWLWKAGGSASSNSDGSITSSVSANQDAGFSIVSYTGTGSNGTIGHGLSSAPESIWIKARTRAEAWLVYHKFDGGTDGRSFLNLDVPNAKFDNGPGSYFQDTPPTASVFYQNTSSYNQNTDTYIAYCFHSVVGYSKLGSYKGNSSSDGSFVFTGFRPTWVLIKSTSSGTQWMIYDSKREGFNVDNDALKADDASKEATDDDIDLLSNGFKLRRSSTNFNNSSHTYIYLAFAEAPFKFANAR